MSPARRRTAGSRRRPPGPAPAPVAVLAAEWSRLELLAACALAGRRGEDPPQGVLDVLARTNAEVAQLRAAGAWTPLTGAGPGDLDNGNLDDGDLDDVDLDVLATVLVPALAPRVAALFATIAPASPDGTASLALVQELFALEPAELARLAARVRPGAPLIARLLVIAPGDADPRRPLRPAAGVLAAALGDPDPLPSPPGSVRTPGGVTIADLVVPPGVEARLREYVTAVRHHHRVAEWGGRPIGGPVALFAGPSGVGKSLAARAVAGELGWPLATVDLSTLVDKYIGETEKNISALLDGASGRPLVLHFEEAESMFGKRGEIREARDRYANLEVSHLLSRIESHVGPCVLSTNLRANLDAAFLRRFQTVVEFPRPDRDARAELWERLLPRAEHRAAGIDVGELAAVELTGGEIHNAAVTACLLAGGDPPAVGPGSVAVAVWRELGKDGRPLHPRDLGPLAEHLPDDVRTADEETGVA